MAGAPRRPNREDDQHGQESKKKEQANSSGADLGFEAQLWAASDALRGSTDAAEYLPAPRPARQAGKHVVLGLIFLKYISDAFEAHHAKLEAERDQGADPENPDLPAAQSGAARQAEQGDSLLNDRFPDLKAD